MNLQQSSVRPLQIVHFSNHKCLTVYMNNIFRESLVPYANSQTNPKVFFHRLAQKFRAYRCLGLNNSYIPYDALLRKSSGLNIKVSIFIRNPKDLIVSGYFYHKNVGEPWTLFADIRRNQSLNSGLAYIHSNILKCPDIQNNFTTKELQLIGNPGLSFTQILNRLPQDKGLMLEMYWRYSSLHFHNLFKLYDEYSQLGDDKVCILRYENIISNEEKCFDKLLNFYGFEKGSILYNNLMARVIRFSYKNIKTKHVRNPKPNQSLDNFTDTHNKLFDKLFPNLMTKLGYEVVKDSSEDSTAVEGETSV